MPEGEEKCTVPDLERDVNMKRALPVDHPLTLRPPRAASAHPQKEHPFHSSTGLPGGFLKEDPGEHVDHFFWKERDLWNLESEVLSCGLWPATVEGHGPAQRRGVGPFDSTRLDSTVPTTLASSGLCGGPAWGPGEDGAEEDPSRS